MKLKSLLAPVNLAVAFFLSSAGGLLAQDFSAADLFSLTDIPVLLPEIRGEKKPVREDPEKLAIESRIRQIEELVKRKTATVKVYNTPDGTARTDPASQAMLDSEIKPLMIEQHGLLKKLADIANAAKQRTAPDRQGEDKKIFLRRMLGFAPSIERREARDGVGFQQDQYRYDFRVDLIYGNLAPKDAMEKKADQITLSPSLSHVSTDGINAALTNRHGRTLTPGITGQWAPLRWNDRVSEVKPGKTAVSLAVLRGTNETDDVALNGTKTNTKKTSWTVNTGWEFNKNFAWGSAKRTHDYRFGLSYSDRRDTTQAAGKTEKSRLGSGSFSGRVRVVLDKAELWSFGSSTSYDFPILDKPAPGKPKPGDETTAQAFSLSRKFGVGTLVAEARRTFGDRLNKIERYQISFAGAL